jgi:hypothetical protein
VRQERLVQAHARSEGFPTAPREAEGGVIGCNSTGDIVALSFSCVEKWLDRKSGNISHCIIIRYEYKVRWHLGYTLVVIHNSSWWFLWFGVHVSRTRAKSAALTKFHPTGDHLHSSSTFPAVRCIVVGQGMHVCRYARLALAAVSVLLEGVWACRAP